MMFRAGPRQVEISGVLTINLVQPPPEPSPAVWIVTQYDGFTATAKGNHMAYTLPDDKDVGLQISYVDSKGNPATVDGDIVWETSDDMICNVGVKEGDSTRAMLHPGQNLGQAQITATADADLGEGTKSIITTLDVTVVAGSAIAGTITPDGEPQPSQQAAPGSAHPGAAGATPAAGARPGTPRS